ncbi:MAG: hypothetical protein GTO22_20990 [Gemmatimonadales bacterium]|nr:hypothetical protein [Gemmatimonadales bacterium]
MRVAEILDLGVVGDKKGCIETLWRGAWRYHYGSLQDKNPIVAARHNGYAVALIDALRDVATEEEVQKVVGESAMKLRKEILDTQDKIERLAVKLLEQIKAKGFKVPDFV